MKDLFDFATNSPWLTFFCVCVIFGSLAQWRPVKFTINKRGCDE